MLLVFTVPEQKNDSSKQYIIRAEIYRQTDVT